MRNLLTALYVDECAHDTPRVALPGVELYVAVRFGPAARNGLNVHVLGGRPHAYRKVIRAGQRMVMARLALGAHEAVLGVPAAELAGRVVALEDVWGGATTRRLVDRLAAARDAGLAAKILDDAIAERGAGTSHVDARTQLVLDAAERLQRPDGTSVTAVAGDLGVSERHLRRAFRASVGVSPKLFAKIARFRRALRAAREDRGLNWAGIAVDAGYYDQAHLISEFRSIAGATPRALLSELRAAHPAS